MSIKQIAIYGKGGIGKSTTSSNLSAVLGLSGYNVLQVGCDPKADSTKNLLNGKKITSVISLLSTDVVPTIDNITHKGFGNVYCLEAGGPEPGVGCAGRGVISVIETLKEINLFEELEIDIVLYDVLGDVVCGGFAVPLRIGLAKEVYLVTSGETMSLYAANNISKAIKRFGTRSDVRLGGVICNSKNAFKEKEKVPLFAKNIGSEVVSWIPRDNIIQQCEVEGKTVIEKEPNVPMADVFRKLSDFIINNDKFIIPTPMSDEEFDEMIKL